MANLKLIHKDSNVTRAKEKEEREKLLNEQLAQIKTDLHDTQAYKVFDQAIYNALVAAIESLNVQHLTNLDIFSLVEVANSMYLVEKINNDISNFDDDTEYNECLKTIASRSALINTIQKQLTELQLSPVQRNALIVETQTNMNAISFSNDDVTAIFEGLI